MTSSDDPGPEVSTSDGRPPVHTEVHSELVEALIHILIEKGVLTKNDSLSLVQTVAQVKMGQIAEGRGDRQRKASELEMLQRMFSSFEWLSDGPGVGSDGGDNVHQLRPPVQKSRPEFPTDN